MGPPALAVARPQGSDGGMTHHRTRRFVLCTAPALLLVRCGQPVAQDTAEPPLFPNETPALRAQINFWADHYDIPRSLGAPTGDPREHPPSRSAQRPLLGVAADLAGRPRRRWGIAGRRLTC